MFFSQNHSINKTCTLVIGCLVWEIFVSKIFSWVSNLTKKFTMNNSNRIHISLSMSIMLSVAATKGTSDLIKKTIKNIQWLQQQ